MAFCRVPAGKGQFLLMVYSFCRQLFRKEPHEGKTGTACALRITGDITSDITGDITSSVILREQNVVWSVAASFLSGEGFPRPPAQGARLTSEPV